MIMNQEQWPTDEPPLPVQRTQTTSGSRFLVTVAILSYVLYMVTWWQHMGFLWDMSVYTRAVAEHAAGGNAYRLDFRFPFIYHPLVLRALGYVNEIVPLPIFLMAMFAVATCWFLAQAYRFARTSPWPARSLSTTEFSIVAMVAFGFGGAGVVSFMSGNITASLHMLLAGCFFYAFRSASVTRRLLFGGVIVLSSVIKPYLLAYAFCFLILTRRTRAIAIIGLISFIALGVWLLGFIAYPVEFVRFIEALEYATLTTNDIGFSMYGFVKKVAGDRVSMIAHLLAVLVAAALLLRAQWRHSSVIDDQMALGILIIVVFMNPRTKDYDFFIAVLALVLWIRLFLPTSAQWIVGATAVLALVPGAANVLTTFGIVFPKAFYSQKWQAMCFGCLAILAMIERSKKSRARL